MRDPLFYRMTDYDRSLLPNEHLRTLDANAVDRKEWEATTGYSIGYPAWGMLYYTVLCRLRPDAFNLIIETGTNIGSSSIVLAQAIKDSKGSGEVRTVELEPEYSAKARDNVTKAGLRDIVRFYEGDAIEQLPEMLTGDDKVAVAFLDGSHLYQQVIREFELVEPHLDDDSVVIFDNTYLIAEPKEDQRVNGALREIKRRFGGNLINLPYCSWYTPGMALWQRQPFGDMTPPA
ncbi:MAG: class I SAM-dependent methyltransferase [Phycisphaera sp.]|nr:MAG: class I SAM-dependent methyltransferase [Phycisphaera sp.]